MLNTKKRWRYAAGLVSATGLLSLVGCASSSPDLNSHEEAQLDDNGKYLPEKETTHWGGIANYVTEEDMVNSRSKRTAEAGTAPVAVVEPAPAKVQPATIAPLTIYFAEGQSTLKEGDKANLDEVVTSLGAHPDMVVAIDGYTDAKGSPEFNKKLSEARAEAVSNELLSKGTAAKQIKYRGHGEADAKPLAKDSTGNPEDRRAVIVSLEVEPTTG